MSVRRGLTLHGLASDLDQGRVTARQLAEAALARIADESTEGARAFIHLDPARVMHDADVQDKARREGRAASEFAGIPLAIKDLFDVAGEVTRAGSKLLASSAPAKTDSVAVARMKAAGFVALGRTNMTEFAYSGIGMNPHYGTPLSIYGRDIGRVPGGSSSGSAVAVAEGVCAVALGTDTGGSCRIPAAFNGIVGFKPSAQRVSREGVYPLSSSFDSVGPIGTSVDCCARAFGILIGTPAANPVAENSRLRFGVLQNFVMDDLDDGVASDFGAALARIARAGHELVDVCLDSLSEMPSLLASGGIVAAEAYVHHAPLIARDESAYDPRVVSRLKFGERISGDDLVRRKARRVEMIAAFAELANGFDAILCPTVAIPPPTLRELSDEGEYRRINGLTLRNTYVFNFLDACAISLPMSEPAAPPTGLMLACRNGQDEQLLGVASMIEGLVRPY